MYDRLIFKLSDENSNIVSLPENNFPLEVSNCIKENLRKDEPNLPTVSEIDVLRHFVLLSNKNHHLQKGFYPLGSCTMKYNPVVNEEISSNPKFTKLHPYQDEEDVQGILEIMYELQDMLLKVTGFDGISLQPVAGAHGEFAGMMIISDYFKSKGEKRSKILIPDSAHGTNPASATLSGFRSVQIKSDSSGEIDLEKNMDEDTAGIMITNPNTLGIFESKIEKISEIVHGKGGLIYMDGANMNALMGIVKPGKIGFDILHLNLHKTFSTPHGGGGPGAGGVAVVESLKEFLPPYIVKFENGKYFLDYPKNSIGSLHSFYGNVNIMVRAWAYLKIMGSDGLKEATEMAIVNANYIKRKLLDIYDLPYKTETMHEVVFSGRKHKKDYNVTTLDIAKRLLDYGFHAPTVYFPLIVSEAIMIEPTETESKETLDGFIDAMKSIDEESKNEPEKVKNAPSNTPVSRPDDIYALKNLYVNWYRENNG
jgi:glycine dehydrogenase subunit 2